MSNADNPQLSILHKFENVKKTFDPANTDHSSMLEVFEDARKEIVAVKNEIAELDKSTKEIEDKMTDWDNKINKWQLLLKEVQKQAKQNSEIASSSSDSYRALLLLEDLMSD